jgi:hypothetical protein
LLRQEVQVAAPERANERIGGGQLADVGTSFGKTLDPRLARFRRPHPQAARAQRPLERAHGKLRVAARRDHGRAELERHDRAGAVDAVRFGQMFEGVLGLALPEKQRPQVQGGINIGGSRRCHRVRVGQLAQAVVHQQSFRFAGAGRLKRLCGPVLVAAAQKAHRLPEGRFPARRLHQERPGDEVVHGLIVTHGRHGEEAAHFFEQRGLYRDLGADLRLAQKLRRPEQIAERVFEFLVRQGRLGRRTQTLRLGLVETLLPCRRGRAGVPQLAHAFQSVLPGPFGQPPPRPPEAAAAARAAAKNLPQHNQGHRRQRAGDAVENRRRARAGAEQRL